jgi:hypothetical protein
MEKMWMYNGATSVMHSSYVFSSVNPPMLMTMPHAANGLGRIIKEFTKTDRTENARIHQNKAK